MFGMLSNRVTVYRAQFVLADRSRWREIRTMCVCVCLCVCVCTCGSARAQFSGIHLSREEGIIIVAYRLFTLYILRLFRIICYDSFRTAQ